MELKSVAELKKGDVVFFGALSEWSATVQEVKAEASGYNVLLHGRVDGWQLFGSQYQARMTSFN